MKLRKSRILFLLLTALIALALVACGGDSAADDAAETVADAPVADEEVEVVAAGDPEAGKALYDQVCIACHGPDGQGIEGLGSRFIDNEFIQAHEDDQLLQFVKTGRPATDPENVSGIDMPPKGGNPALTDAEILDIIAYLRTLQ
ncbi:MAG: cytochrome c [Candidatus Promineifilaceae bacterium]|nr:cytochrome c [Candidatus Promineifilaceae bacterium]